MAKLKTRRHLVVIGNGMVGHRFLQELRDCGGLEQFRVSVFGEEPRLAYDRVRLSDYFGGATAAALSLVEPGEYQSQGIGVHLNASVVRIDRQRRRVKPSVGRSVPYDRLVLAMGSTPFVPPIPGRALPQCFVYRTLDDLEAIRDAAKTSRRGVVIGGGLLGLEAANALLKLGLQTHVVEFSDRLMPMQLDSVGGSVLRERVEQLGVTVHLAKNTQSIVAGHDGRVAALRFADATFLATDLVVFSAGIRPRDELAQRAGLELGPRGGVKIDDQCRTSDSNIYAIGECASFRGRTYGLVAPGYSMACVAAQALTDGSGELKALETSTKLKLLGVDVASFGDAFAESEGAQRLSFFDDASGVYRSLTVDTQRELLLGGMLVGDAADYASLVGMMRSSSSLGGCPERLLLAHRGGGSAGDLGMQLSAEALICSCHNVSKGSICQAIAQGSLTQLAEVKQSTGAGTGCGSCVSLVTQLLRNELKRAGEQIPNHLCEHFAFSRQELFHLVLVEGIGTFGGLLQKHGKGAGCEICKPAVASMLASVWNEHILDAPHAALQDTNDRHLANMQRDGSYSVVPRLPGGEVTPDQLIALGAVAKRFKLYTKITGGQRVDMLGARLEQLPDIWRELAAAGFESGHAYGKALRTVKSCVGSTWCRYGVQDSVSLAILLEQRYKGLRSPHKLKGAVSGCARECAEAQSKDFGVIATAAGYNLYLCGNGGMKPRHAVLFAADLDQDTLVWYLDRFFMFYVRTADRLQRTATWFAELEGGIDYLRQVLIEDSLGICAELERQMQHVVSSYRCEWAATLEDPAKLRAFRPFVNSDLSDGSVVFVADERGQRRPASWSEKTQLARAGRFKLPVLHPMALEGGAQEQGG